MASHEVASGRPGVCLPALGTESAADDPPSIELSTAVQRVTAKELLIRVALGVAAPVAVASWIWLASPSPSPRQTAVTHTPTVQFQPGILPGIEPTGCFVKLQDLTLVGRSDAAGFVMGNFHNATGKLVDKLNLRVKTPRWERHYEVGICAPPGQTATYSFFIGDSLTTIEQFTAVQLHSDGRWLECCPEP